jgi:hypothetical protein
LTQKDSDGVLGTVCICLYTGFMSDFAICHLQRSLCPLCCINDSTFYTIFLGVFRTGWVVVYNRKYGVACTVTRFVSTNAKFGLCIVVVLNRTLVVGKKRTFKQCCGTGFTDSGYELIKSGYELIESGSSFSSESGSGSRLLMTKKWKKQLEKIYLYQKLVFT